MFLLSTTGCSSIKGALVYGQDMREGTELPNAEIVGIAAEGAVDERWRVGAEFQMLNDAFGKEYKVMSSGGLCFFQCEAYETVSDLNMIKTLVTVSYQPGKRIFYTLGYGRYSTEAGKGGDWFDPVYNARPGESLPSGNTLYIGVGYQLFDSLFGGESTLSIEARLMQQKGDGVLQTSTGVREDLTNLNAVSILLRLGNL